MVSPEHRLGLFIAVPVYFLLLCGAAFWAYRRTQKLEGSGVNDHLSAHYLGGRSFGAFLTAGTLFASLFSGYTVVGVVNEGFYRGWFSLRWLVGAAPITMGYIATSLRLRKLSLIRNHQSPVDFITDRYQSQLLRYTIFGLQTVATIIYLSAQVVALKGTFNAMFGLEQSDPVPVIVMFTIILLFEYAGGLSSVALTDCVQGVIMVLSFLCLASVITKRFGGWKVLDPSTFPRPEFYQTPSEDQQWAFWQFSLILFAFFTQPHAIQRVYAAESLTALRWANVVMCVGPWFTLFVSIFMGTVGVQMLNGVSPSGNPFSDIMEELMKLGGFPKFTAVVAFTASLAAIMSTADSLVIALSQLVTTEVVYPMRPQTTPRGIAWIGRLTSLITVAVALVVGIFWNSGITDLSAIQFPLAIMTAPSFLWGLYAPTWLDVHPWCLAIGAAVPSIYIFVIYFVYLKPDNGSLPLDAGVTGLVVHVVTTFSLETLRRIVHKQRDTSGTGMDGSQVVYNDRPAWDIPKLARFGEHAMTPPMIEKAMVGVHEPFTNLWYVAFYVYAQSMCTPLVPEGEPPLSADGVFVYAPAIVRGLPWWAFKIMVVSVVPYLISFISIVAVPDFYPQDEKKIAVEGIDPDLVEMTPAELGRRMSYDENNSLIRSRRESIVKAMEDLGIQQEKEDFEQAAPTPRQRRLSAMVLGQSAALVQLAEEEGDTEDEANMADSLIVT